MAESRNSIRLEVILSREIQRKGKTKGATATWHVDPSKPWNEDSNFGRLCHMLEITNPCELCHYAEGRPEKVIDLTRTPEHDCYRKGMQVFLQPKLLAKTAEQKMAAAFGITLTEDEQKLLRKLRNNVVQALGPDDECPLCTRTMPQIDPATYGSPEASMAGSPTLRSSPSRMFGSSSPGSTAAWAGAPQSPAGLVGGDVNASSNFGVSAPVLRPEVGVQCGQTSRLGDSDEVVSAFGTAARFREHSASVFGGPPMDFPGRNKAGPNFDFSPTILDLKSQAEQYQRERDQLALELREMTKQKVTLERWKSDHRCEVSAEVAKTRNEMEKLQCHMRELMRGREEVFSMLQQRRLEGSLYSQETPRPYTPFAVTLPNLDAPVPDPHKLLSKDTYNGGTGTGFDLPSKTTSATPDRETSVSVEVVKRPSGLPESSPARVMGYGFQQDDASADVMLAKQAMGECMLKIASSSSDSFSVKRKLGSQMRGGRHIFTLSSLDGVVTDEIHVEELERVSTQGQTGLNLETNLHQWQIHLNPTERQRWLHWLYALNPYLSATAHASNGGVPNSY